VTFKNTQKNENVRLNGNGNAFRVGRKICTDMKKDELVRIAGILKIKPGEKETKKTLCKKIQAVRNDLSKPNPNPSPPLNLQKTSTTYSCQCETRCEEE